MKKKKVCKTLTLGKTIIAALGTDNLKSIRGGGGDGGPRQSVPRDGCEAYTEFPNERCADDI